ncbi:MAG: hypothetical protein ACKO90_42580, partial [Microcystis panniformis]
MVNVAGNYTISLHTETATVWSENSRKGCKNTAYVSKPVIQPDGLIVAGLLYWSPDNWPGQLPGPGLLLANDGNFYGVTSLDHGTIYRVNYKGDFTVLYKFSGHGKLN